MTLQRERADPAAFLHVIMSDAVRGLGMEGTWAEPVLAAALRPPARRFRQLLLDADAAAATGGLDDAANSLLAAFSGPVAYSGLENIPRDGPLLVAANHPGTVDTPAVWHALAGRADLRTIALDRPFVPHLAHLAEHLLLVGEERTPLVRSAAEHLGGGGAVLVFPAGEIEPDPTVRPRAARRALTDWARSPELFARLVPGLRVLPVAVSGVLSRRALAGPVARLRRHAADREITAATLQILLGDRRIQPRVRVGVPLEGPERLTARLASAMEDLFERPLPR